MAVAEPVYRGVGVQRLCARRRIRGHQLVSPSHTQKKNSGFLLNKSDNAPGNHQVYAGAMKDGIPEKCVTETTCGSRHPVSCYTLAEKSTNQTLRVALRDDVRIPLRAGCDRYRLAGIS